jgi:DNA-binding NarL/FixJ family response regulator
MKIKVVLADDHVLIREGLKKLLEFDGSMEVIAEAGNGVQCLEILKTVKPDILLLDINMPKLNGIDVLDELKANKSEVKVLMLTIHNEVEYLLKAVDIGAEGYILKDAGFSELKQAIETVFRGGKYIQPHLVPALKSRLASQNADREKIARLTEREIEILEQMTGGLFDNEIGEKLNINEKVVKSYVSNLIEKLELSDRNEAAMFAIKNNIVKMY